MILISSHLDRVIQDYSLAYKGGLHVGLLDNFIGVLVAYLSLYDDHNLAELEKAGEVAFYHGRSEEWSRLDAAAPRLGKSDLAIVVDVAAGEDFDCYDFTIDNVSGLSKRDAKGLLEDLRWQGFKTRLGLYSGNPDDEDESWQWRKRGVPTFSFTVPIFAKDDGWHRIQMDNSVSYEEVKKAAQGLKRTINHFIES